MEMETTLLQGIRVTDNFERLDAACKRVLSEKIILAKIMQDCLDEYRDCDIYEIAENYIEGQPQVGTVPVLPDESGSVIRGMDTEDKSIREGVITYDIRFHALVPGSDDLIGLIVNVEAQNDFYPGYPLVKRGIYYCSRMISSQYGREFTGSQYGKLKKVYSIWICMKPPQNRENTITRYRITEEHLVGEIEEPRENYDLLSVVMICLGKEGGGNYDGVLKMLDVLFSTETGVTEKRKILQEEFGIQMTRTLEGEVSEMCNFSKGVWENGMEKGMEKGIEKGILKSIQNLMKNANISMEQAMDMLGVPESERETYQEMLRK